jgi:hypothetical protein
MGLSTIPSGGAFDGVLPVLFDGVLPVLFDGICAYASTVAYVHVPLASQALGVRQELGRKCLDTVTYPSCPTPRA